MMLGDRRYAKYKKATREDRLLHTAIGVLAGAAGLALVRVLRHKKKRYTMHILAEKGSYLDNLPVRNFGLPHDCSLYGIVRNGEQIPFRKTTCILPGDVLMVKTSDKYLARLYRDTAKN